MASLPAVWKCCRPLLRDDLLRSPSGRDADDAAARVGRPERAVGLGQDALGPLQIPPKYRSVDLSMPKSRIGFGFTAPLQLDPGASPPRTSLRAAWRAWSAMLLAQ